MAYKSTGKAGKSASGASMSKYDVEVEARLQKLEAEAHPKPTGATQKRNDDRLKALENDVQKLLDSISSGGGGADPRVDKIIAHLAQKENIDDLL
tara:strand:- start:347 stop:631 length:285 start_codon:yes stop_codon:yes gene_type:complete